jgi:hypothetical protein
MLLNLTVHKLDVLTSTHHSSVLLQLLSGLFEALQVLR